MENLKDILKDEDAVSKLNEMLKDNNFDTLYKNGKIRISKENPIHYIVLSSLKLALSYAMYKNNEISLDDYTSLFKEGLFTLADIFEVDITENQPCDRACPFLSYAYCSKYDQQLEHIDDETFFKIEECK